MDATLPQWFGSLKLHADPVQAFYVHLHPKYDSLIARSLVNS